MQNALDGARLQAAIAAVHRAGMPGVFAEVRSGAWTWRGAAGLADVTTGRPVTAGMRHRIGSITKTFTAAAVMQQVEAGRIGLDAPVARYLPQLVPGARGRAITVRMLLNHSSGLADYLPRAYPSLRALPALAETTPQSLEDQRWTRFAPTELIGMGVAAPAVAAPGARPGVYANTNYLLLGQLLEHVTGTPAQRYISRNVIARAGLRDTGFPAGPHIRGSHPCMYEAWFGMLEPPRDYSVYDMSWVGPAAALVSTVADLNRFFGLLLAGAIVGASSLAQMQRSGPVISFEGKRVDYGLGLHRVDLPGLGVFWGHDGTTWGAGALSLTRADGKRQLSVATNLTRWQRLDASGRPQPSVLDGALAALHGAALGGDAPGLPTAPCAGIA